MSDLYSKNLGNKDEVKTTPITFPNQSQDVQPGFENLMNPKPIFDNPNYLGSGKLKDMVAIITGGDSGIGRAISIFYAKEGADIVIVYYNEHDDANETKVYIENIGRRCLLIPGDLKDEEFCKSVVEQTISKFSHLDILVNNACVQYPQNSIEDITAEQLQNTFQTNIFSMFYLTKAALKHLNFGSTIINTTSVTAYKGNATLIDYSATKGAIVTLTKSLALSLADKGVRVNAVAPGPIWTPLIPASSEGDKITTFGSDTLMKRAGHPVELAPTYVYLASTDSTYVTGQILHVNGGEYLST